MVKKTFVQSYEGKFPTGATSITLKVPTMPQNVLLCYDRIVGVDFTSTTSKITVGFTLGKSEKLLETFHNISAGQAVHVKGKIFVPGNYVLFVRFEGATAGDRVALFAYGYVTDFPE